VGGPTVVIGTPLIPRLRDRLALEDLGGPDVLPSFGRTQFGDPQLQFLYAMPSKATENSEAG
jgi:hypothetical protein